MMKTILLIEIQKHQQVPKSIESEFRKECFRNLCCYYSFWLQLHGPLWCQNGAILVLENFGIALLILLLNLSFLWMFVRCGRLDLGNVGATGSIAFTIAVARIAGGATDSGFGIRCKILIAIGCKCRRSRDL